MNNLRYLIFVIIAMTFTASTQAIHCYVGTSFPASGTIPVPCDAEEDACFLASASVSMEDLGMKNVKMQYGMCVMSYACQYMTKETIGSGIAAGLGEVNMKIEDYSGSCCYNDGCNKFK